MLNPPSDTCQALARNLAALNERQIRALYWHTQCQVMRAPQAQFHGWIRLADAVRFRYWQIKERAERTDAFRHAAALHDAARGADPETGLVTIRFGEPTS